MVVAGRYDPSSEDPISLRIIQLVGDASDREATDLEPLGDIIDVDALDAFLDLRPDDDPCPFIQISFAYEGYRIEIDGKGTVSVLRDD